MVVDDGSADQTSAVASRFKEVRCIRQTNQCKGAAVQRGVRECTGDYVLVQDADLEYDPMDYLALVAPLSRGERMAVYGSRVLGQKKRERVIRTSGKTSGSRLGPLDSESFFIVMHRDPLWPMDFRSSNGIQSLSSQRHEKLHHPDARV